jgi:hypothetical protein
MQTVCAHCYTLLSRRQQRMACILCTTCERNWNAGQPTRQNCALPEWKGGFASILGQPVSLDTVAPG